MNGRDRGCRADVYYLGYHACEYIWSLKTGNVLDPTDENGKCLEGLTAFGGLIKVSTMLARVNESPKGTRPNICAVEKGNVVSFLTLHPIQPGEELFLHYGSNYARSMFFGPIVTEGPE